MGTYRELDELTDYLSRIVDYGDWFLNPTGLCTVWGPHTVERFTNFHNRQTL